MEGKINFGIDYLHLMGQMNQMSKKPLPQAFIFAKLFLVLEWEFTPDEVDQVNDMFWEKVNKDKLDKLGIVIERLVSHLNTNQDAKSKLLTDLIVVTSLDNDLSNEEKDLLFSITNDFDFRKSEVLNLGERADHVLGALRWFVTSLEDINDDNS